MRERFVNPEEQREPRERLSDGEAIGTDWRYDSEDFEDSSKAAWHGFYNVHFDTRSKEVVYEDLDQRDQQELIRFNRKKMPVIDRSKKSNTNLAFKKFIASSKNQPQNDPRNNKNPVKSALKHKSSREIMETSSERRIPFTEGDTKHPNFHPNSKQGLKSSFHPGRQVASAKQENIPSSPKVHPFGDPLCEQSLTLLSRPPSRPDSFLSKNEEQLGHLPNTDTRGMADSNMSKYGYHRHSDWTMKTIDRHMMKNVSRVVSPFIKEMDDNINTNINTIIRHLSNDIHSISNRLHTLTDKLYDISSSDNKKHKDINSNAHVVDTTKITTKHNPNANSITDNNAYHSMKRDKCGSAVRSKNTIQVYSERSNNAIQAESKYFKERDKRKLDNLQAPSSTSLNDIHQRNDIEYYNKNKTISSQRLKDKRHEVLLKRRKSHGYMDNNSNLNPQNNNDGLEKR